MKFQIPQDARIVDLLSPAADAGGRTSSVYVSLKNVQRAYIVAYLNQGNAATIALTPKQATAVAGTGSKVTGNLRIWRNLDCSASDAFVRDTDAANYTTDAALKNKIVIFMIDPTDLDVAGGFDCIGLTTGASNVANITSAFMIVCEQRFGGANSPTVITD